MKMSRFAKCLTLFCCFCGLMPLPVAMAEALPRIGLLVYNAEDTFMQTVCARIQKVAEGFAEVMLMDGENSQTVQNDQQARLLREGVDALIINAVDRTTAVYMIRVAMKYDVPVVFINREPLYEDLALYGKAYYVGNDPKESGTMSGELIADYFKALRKAEGDENRVIRYVMLKGEPGHQDAELRTIYSVKAIQAAGFEAKNLVEEPAMWVRTLAQEKMSHIIASYGEQIDCVLANNDEMALGAIDALKAAGFFEGTKYLPVVGVDATSHANAALREGTLLGTVLNDGETMGDAALKLALLLAQGKTVDERTFPYHVDRGVYVWIPSRKVTAETL